jgi:hypothetical protein
MFITKLHMPRTYTHHIHYNTRLHFIVRDVLLKTERRNLPRFYGSDGACCGTLWYRRLHSTNAVGLWIRSVTVATQQLLRMWKPSTTFGYKSAVFIIFSTRRCVSDPGSCSLTCLSIPLRRDAGWRPKTINPILLNTQLDIDSHGDTAGVVIVTDKLWLRLIKPRD